MDEFELEDNLEFILQSIQELIEDQGDDNPFGEVNQNELLANLVNYDQDNLMPDVSAEDVANGKDVQGIPWEKMLFPRDQYREMKVKGYKNYQNLSYAREDALMITETKAEAQQFKPVIGQPLLGQLLSLVVILYTFLGLWHLGKRPES